MDKNILHTLSDFLPKEVIDEISIANGIMQKKSELPTVMSIDEEQSGRQIPVSEQQEFEVDGEGNEVGGLDENTVNETDGSTDNQKPLSNGVKSVEPIVVGEKKSEEDDYNIFSFIKNNNLTDGDTLVLLNKSDKIHYGFCNQENTLNLEYFIFPVSISRIDRIIELYTEIDSVFKGIDPNKWIPNFLLEGKINENYIINIDKTENYLIYMIISFLNGNGKQLQTVLKKYNNFKLEKIDSDFINNPDFYRKFLQRDKSDVNVLIETLDNPKVRFLKYFLIKLSKNTNNNTLKSKLELINETYLRNIKACNNNINLHQYNDLKVILALISRLIDQENRIHIQLIEKMNDLYEFWLFKTMVVYFNSGGLELTEDISKLLNKKIYKTIHIDEIFKEINLNLVNKIGKKRYKEYLPIGKISSNLFHFEKIIYFKDIHGLKTTIIEKFKEKEINLRILEFNGIVYGKSFIKEDFNGIIKNNKNIKTTEKNKILELNKLKLSTFSLKKLNNEGYTISVSLGGNTSILGENIDNNLSEKIISQIPHLKEVCTNTTRTPDFIIKIEKEGKLCGSIIMDAKFSKYPFFIENGKSLDYTAVLHYYSELSKNFSTTDIGNNFPFKIVILFPGDKKYGNILNKINNYFQRNTNIVAVPLMVGDDSNLLNNLGYLEDYIIQFRDDIIS